MTLDPLGAYGSGKSFFFSYLSENLKNTSLLREGQGVKGKKFQKNQFFSIFCPSTRRGLGDPSDGLEKLVFRFFSLHRQWLDPWRSLWSLMLISYCRMLKFVCHVGTRRFRRAEIVTYPYSLRSWPKTPGPEYQRFRK